MVYLRRVLKRHPGLRSVMAVLLSIAMVLNSTPIRAVAEEVDDQVAVAEVAAPAEETTEASDDEASSDEAPAEEALPEEAAPAAEATEATDEEAVSNEAVSDLEEASEVATKRTYTYEDAAVKVTATLEKADAIPDAAELKVTAVTEDSKDYNYAAYMGALNKDFDGAEAYTAENTLLYDVAFLVADESGNTVEVEPESGSVEFKLEFKRSQLSEDISAEDADSVQLIHLPLKENVRDSFDTTAQAVDIDASDVLVESVDADLTVGNKEDASFVLDSLSIIAASTHPANFGTTDQTSSQVNFSLALGRAVEYGIVADTYEQKNHQQTNFAVKNFKNTGGINGEPDLAGTWTVPYQIGSIGTPKLRFGTNTYQSEEVQYDVYLPKSYETNINDYVQIDGGGKDTVNFIYEDESTINGNITSMISGANEKSQTMASHATTVQLDNSVVTDQNQLVIDTTSYADDAVIYLNVPEGPDYSMIRTVLGMQSSLHLHKKPGQVIVLNVLGSTPVSIQKYIVTLPGEDMNTKDDKYSTYSPSGQNDPLNERIDEQISQKVIWNFPNASKVTMNTSAGVFLVPNGSVDVVGTSAGWIVSGGTVTTDGCEFHFVYRDRHYTPQTPSDGPSRALRFTNFKGMKDADGNEIGLGGRQFPFSLYETDSSFVVADSAAPIETVDSNNNATVNFTAINYTEDTINAHENGDFYYVIKEDNGGSTANGVTNWDGQINIKLHATIDGDNIVFTSNYYRYLSSADMSAGNTDNTVRDIEVGGEEFTLGRVFNFYKAKTDIELGAKKTLDGKAPEAEAFEFVLTEVADANGTAITPAEGETVYTDTKKNDGTGSVTFDKIEYTAADASREGVKHYYKITEKNAGNQSLKYDATEYVVTVTVTDDGQGNLTATADKTANDITFKNETITGDLVITKSVDGENLTQEEFEGALKFTVQGPDGKYLDKDGNPSDEPVELTLKDGGFTTTDGGKTWTKTYEGVAGGKYTVTETNSAVPGYALVGGQSTTEADVTIDEKGETVTAALKDVYEEVTGDLVITKSVDGENLTQEEFEGALEFTVQGPDGKYLDKDGNPSDEPVELTLKDGGFTTTDGGKTWTKTYKGVAGGKYTVTETNSAVPGYALVDGQSTTKADATIDEKGEIVTAALKDVYEEVTGSLTVTKSVQNVQAMAKAIISKATFPVTIKNADNKFINAKGEAVDTDPKLTVALGENLTINNLPFGEYTVTEGDPAALDGFIFKSVSSNPSDGKGAIVNMNDEIKVQLTNVYEETSVKVSKTDATGEKELAGAEISIYEVLVDADGNKTLAEEATESWTSEEGKVHEVKGLKTGTEYVLRETVAPAGYTIATDTTFTIDETGNVTVTDGDQAELSDDGVILIEDTLTSFSVSKTDIASGDELEGATIVIKDSKGNEFTSWTSQADDEETADVNEGIHTVEGLKLGEEYTLSETVAPDGYTITTDIKFTLTQDEDGKLVINTEDATVSEDGVLLVEDALTKVNISKVEVGGSDEIAGAELQIMDAEGKNIVKINSVDQKWTSEEGETHTVEGLTSGTYILRETVAPNGHTITTDIEFTINADGSISTGARKTVDDETGETTILVEDAKTVVRISKTDITGDEELSGAAMKIVDADNNEIDSWTSKKGEVHVVEGKLNVGEEYKLIETTAPDGYTVTAETTFKLTDDGKLVNVKSVATDEGGNQIILVKDDQTVVRVSKTDITGDTEVAGATIQIKDSKGAVVYEWESDGKNTEVIRGKLKVGETYTLHEETAPDGYTVASDTTFSIAADGSIIAGDNTTTDSEGNTVLLVKDAKTSIKVSKTDIASGDELEGATIVIKDSKGNEFTSWTSQADDEETADVNEGIHTVEGLKLGEEYTLSETVAPDGYTITTDIKFTLTQDEDGKLVINTEDATVSEDGVLLVEDSLSSVKVSKVDLGTGDEVAGATIQILDEEGNVKVEWESVADDEETEDANEGIHEVTGLIVGKTYTLHEEVAPDGYTIATDTKFTLNEDGTVSVAADADDAATLKNGVLLVEDSLTSIKVSKIDVADGKEIADAEIAIYEYTTDDEGNETWADKPTESWTSEEGKTHEITGLKTNTTYVMVETVAPDGYTIAAETRFSIDSDGTINLIEGVMDDETGVILVEDAKTVVRVSKVDIADGNEIADAKIAIYEYTENSDGTESRVDEATESWTSEEGKTHEIIGLKTGTKYVMVEEVAPDGYTIAAETRFSIDSDGTINLIEGTITTDDEGNDVILVEDAKTVLRVKKTDIANGKEVAGAKLQILDSEGNEFASWTSTVDNEETEGIDEGIYEVEGLLVGEEYTLRETTAPDGYTVTTDIKFTIDENGKVTAGAKTEKDADDNDVILVEDAKTKVTISKTDLGNGEELEGAEIVIKDSTGKVVESWTSTTEPHVIEGLKTGEEYTLEETTAPDGYKVTASTTFTIDEHGKVTTTGTKTVNEETGEEVLLVEDEMTKISVSKTDIASGDELEGAHIQIIKKVEKDGKLTEEVVEEWDSTTEAHVVTGLTTGVQYILRETVAPDGYTVTSDTTFSIDALGNVFAEGNTTTDADGNTVLLVEDAKTVVRVSKTDLGTGEEVKGAKIRILDKDGKVVEEWTSEGGAHVIEGLKTGEEYTLEETTAPNGYTVTDKTTFTIDENGKVTYTGRTTTDKDGNEIMLIEDALTVVKIDKIDFATKAKLSGAHIQLLDADGKLVDEWDSSASTAHKITGLTTDVVYTLKETVAPKGFNTLPFDITFTINADGSVTLIDYLDEAGNHYAVTSVEDGITTISLEDDADLIGKKDDEENGGKKQDTSKKDDKSTKKSTATKATKSSTTSATKLAKTSDPAAATGLATLILSAVGSGLVTTGFARKRREKRQ